MRPTISHTTRYRYDEPLDHGLQRLRLLPRSGPSQTVHKWKVSTTGAIVEAEYDDHFGNRIMLLNVDPTSRSLEIDVQGEVESITLSKNQIRENRAPENRVGVRIGKDTRDIQLDGNAIEGVAEKVVV